MNCPEHGLIIRKHLQVWHHQRADVPRKYVTWREVLNPLRYEIAFGPGPGRYWYINNDAVLHRMWRNAVWKTTRLCWLRGHEWRELNSFQRPTMMCDRCMKTRPAEF